eukprot:1171038-Amphidinium_carterae.1
MQWPQPAIITTDCQQSTIRLLCTSVAVAPTFDYTHLKATAARELIAARALSTFRSCKKPVRARSQARSSRDMCRVVEKCG